jgi:hypothetical protein
MLLGFLAILFAASAGSFIAFDTTEAFIKDPQLLDSWQLLTARSAHGHTNLFGLIHIAMGLSFPYSVLSSQMKKLQTLGLFAGTFAMSVLMLIRSYVGPAAGIDALDVVIGGCLSCALVAIASHCYGLARKILR